MFGFLFGKKEAKTAKFIKTNVSREKLLTNMKTSLQTLGSGNMSEVVKLPAGEDINEWLSVNTIDFFNELNLIWGTMSAACTSSTCPQMCAGATHVYLWQDNSRYTVPTEMSAADYVVNLMDWTESQLNDEAIFPLQPSQVFPRDFKKRISLIYRRFFRVYAHIYHHHMDAINEIKADVHLNTCFKHFIYFVREFQLISPNDIEPLKTIIAKLFPNGY